MAIFSLVSWWYSAGWLILAKKCGWRLNALVGFFSIPLLLSSLFAPFRQISAGQQVQGPLGMQLRALGDLLFSRFIGAAVRSILIVVGIITIVLVMLLQGIVLLAWPLLPFLPVAGMVLMGMGVIYEPNA